MREFHGARAQDGAALVVALLLLLIVTLLGLASLRGALMQERMSANSFDRALAFQAAELGLLEGEKAVTSAPCSATDCPKRDGFWLDDSNWESATEVNVSALGSLAPATTYLRERLGDANGKPVFRITSRAHAEGRSEVMLQSTYQVN